MNGSLLPEWLQLITPPMAFTALAVIGLKVAWEKVMRKRNGNENGKLAVLLQKVERMNVDVQQTSKDMKEVSQKLDALTVEVAGNYVRQASLADMGNRIDDIRERAIKAETRIETLEPQVRKLFERANDRKG